MQAGDWPGLGSLWGASVGFDVWAAAAAAPAQLAARRAERLAALLRVAARLTRYAPLLAGRDPARVPLEALPPTSKHELMAHFADGVADPAIELPALRAFLADRGRLGQPFLGRYMVWESSGSTGEPGVFVQDAGAMAVYDALEALRRRPLRPLARLADPWFLGHRIAFVGAVDGHFASTVSMHRLMRLNPTIRARLHLVSFLQPLAAMTVALEAIRPSIIATYPSMAALLAEECLAGRALRARASAASSWVARNCAGVSLISRLEGRSGGSATNIAATSTGQRRARPQATASRARASSVPSSCTSSDRGWSMGHLRPAWCAAAAAARLRAIKCGGVA